MARDKSLVIHWIEARKRLLDLIGAKVAEDGRMGFLVSHCKRSDQMLFEEVQTESLRVQSEQQAP